jgi:hypothetical protein
MAADSLPRYGIVKDELNDLDKAKYLLVILEIQRSLAQPFDDLELKELLKVYQDTNDDWRKIEDRYRSIMKGDDR